ncbi:MAG: phosphoglycerate kinase [Rickettsiales bacterium]|jgi:phosphoglycerate kinase|nr:phosphoglycerate kinase [Rickettsiales bacterium]
MKTLHDINFDLRGKYVLLRCDFNVQIRNGRVVDGFRIDASKPTIDFLTSRGARVVICAHLGRPTGPDMALSLRPVAQYLGAKFYPDALDKPVLENGQVALLENLRFHAGEEKNDADFAHVLATGFDIYVDDAFAVTHRAAASNVGVTKFLPSFAGLLLESEINHLTGVMKNPARPLVAIVGGSKIDTKLAVLESLSHIADTLIVGGLLGLQKFNVRGGAKIIRPIDKIHNADGSVMDEGLDTIAEYSRAIAGAKTILWNGTLGAAEHGFPDGTRAVALAVADSGAVTIIGGGDTAAALEMFGLSDKMTYISTGGGAFLEFIEGKKLPGIAAIPS